MCRSKSCSIADSWNLFLIDKCKAETSIDELINQLYSTIEVPFSHVSPSREIDLSLLKSSLQNMLSILEKYLYPRLSKVPQAPLTQLISTKDMSNSSYPS